MADTYTILGFADDTTAPVVLYESSSYNECDKWRIEYVRFGNWGGYDSLALYEIAPDQSAQTIHLHDMCIQSWERI